MDVQDARSVEQLVDALASGRAAAVAKEVAEPRVKYVFFWGHRQRDPSELGTECLSQWYPASFEVEGIRYATAEHFMMAEKARLFGDEEQLAKIVATDEPGAAKKFGRLVQGFDAETWGEAAFEIVVRGNVAKFSHDPAFEEFLLGTGERVLVEASPRDRIWGVGMGKTNPDATEPSRWRGRNLLGFALMEARARLACRRT